MSFNQQAQTIKETWLSEPYCIPSFPLLPDCIQCHQPGMRWLHDISSMRFVLQIGMTWGGEDCSGRYTCQKVNGRSRIVRTSAACHRRAECQLADGEYRCVCRKGFQGDGYAKCKGKYICILVLKRIRTKYRLLKVQMWPLNVEVSTFNIEISICSHRTCQ